MINWTIFLFETVQLVEDKCPSRQVVQVDPLTRNLPVTAFATRELSSLLPRSCSYLIK